MPTTGSCWSRIQARSQTEAENASVIRRGFRCPFTAMVKFTLLWRKLNSCAAGLGGMRGSGALATTAMHAAPARSDAIAIFAAKDLTLSRQPAVPGTGRCARRVGFGTGGHGGRRNGADVDPGGHGQHAAARGTEIHRMVGPRCPIGQSSSGDHNSIRRPVDHRPSSSA